MVRVVYLGGERCTRLVIKSPPNHHPVLPFLHLPLALRVLVFVLLSPATVNSGQLTAYAVGAFPLEVYPAVDRTRAPTAGFVAEYHTVETVVSTLVMRVHLRTHFGRYWRRIGGLWYALGSRGWLWRSAALVLSWCFRAFWYGYGGSVWRGLQRCSAFLFLPSYNISKAVLNSENHSPQNMAAWLEVDHSTAISCVARS